MPTNDVSSTAGREAFKAVVTCLIKAGKNHVFDDEVDDCSTAGRGSKEEASFGRLFAGNCPVPLHRATARSLLTHEAKTAKVDIASNAITARVDSSASPDCATTNTKLANNTASASALANTPNTPNTTLKQTRFETCTSELPTLGDEQPCNNTSNDTFTDQHTTTAYPTDQKERERDHRNKLKEQGIEKKVKKKKPKIIEDHHDDCGTDFSSLDMCEDAFAEFEVCPPCQLCDMSSDEELIYEYLTKEMLNHHPTMAFPVDTTHIARAQPGGEPQPGPDSRAPAKKDSPCPGCRWSRSRDDFTHTHTRKIGECSYPYDEPFIPECQACLERKHREHPTHTHEENKCRWANRDYRKTTKRKRRELQHQRPHEPVPQINEDPTTTHRIQPDGAELGSHGERQVVEADENRATGSSSSSSAPMSQAQQDAVERNNILDGVRGTRGPDQQPRERRTWKETGTDPENPHDWTTFDIGRVTRLLRCNNLPAAKLTLRKLHVRWWHASSATMNRMLSRVGIPENVLEMIPEVCQTCKVCREWQRTGPGHQTTAEIPDSFNAQVECDLVFYKKHIIFQLIDRCTRWHAAKQVENREDDTLIRALDELWMSTHGPPAELISDSETGIKLSDAIQKYLNRKGIKFNPRGKDQHTRYIERRGQVLRDQLHKMESQLCEEGMALTPFHHTLAEATFAGNALTAVGNYSPYTAVYGRVPRLLPHPEQLEAPDRAASAEVLSLAHMQRLREVALQGMIEASAKARIGRALNTRTTMPAERLELAVGDDVDFYRQPSSKDAPGWSGPATVADASRVTHNVVTVRWQGKLLECQLQNVRKHLVYLCYFDNAPNKSTHAASLSHIRRIIEQLHTGKMSVSGSIEQEGQPMTTTNAATRAGLFRAACYYGKTRLHLPNIKAVRIGKGQKTIPMIRGCGRSYTLCWHAGNEHMMHLDHHNEDDVVKAIHLNNHFFNVHNLRFIQFLCSTDTDNTHDDDDNETNDEDRLTSTPSRRSTDRLSTIPEGESGEESDDDSLMALASYLAHKDRSKQEILEATKEALDAPLEDVICSHTGTDSDPVGSVSDSQLPLDLLTLDCGKSLDITRRSFVNFDDKNGVYFGNQIRRPGERRFQGTKFQSGLVLEESSTLYIDVADDSCHLFGLTPIEDMQHVLCFKAGENKAR